MNAFSFASSVRNQAVVIGRFAGRGAAKWRLVIVTALVLSLTGSAAQAENPVQTIGSAAAGQGVTADSPAARWATREGRHIKLITDLPDTDRLDEWVTAFDAAVPQWAEYFGRDLDDFRDWRVSAYVMVNKEAFAAPGYVPPNLPSFRFGYQAGNRIWVMNQPTEEYTRHLLLHEGVHAAGFHLFGGCGPPWFMEGIAEYLSTHAWDAQSRPPVRVGIIPTDPLAVAGWGRIELIQAAREQQQVPRIESVMKYSDMAHREVAPYAWSWLAVTLMESYPEYREVLRDAAPRGRDTTPEFNRRIYQSLRAEWPVLVARWSLLVQDIEYGWDAERQRVELPARPLPLRDGPLRLELAVDRGWQAASVGIAAGQRVRVEASGRYVVRQPPAGPDGELPRAWETEADGVTIRYHRGEPLGKLIACLVPLRVDNTKPNLPELQIEVIGAEGELTAATDSWLLFRVNEAADQLFDNRGKLTIRIDSAD